MRLTFTGEPKPSHRIGLDAEALPAVSWSAPPIYRHAVCFSWGAEDDIRYIETVGRRPGRFKVRQLAELRAAVAAPGAIIVGHNALRYDLPLLNGVLVAHGLAPLPAIRCQDTMGELKTGLAYRNTLSAQCKRYGVQLKTGGPDWDLVMCGDANEWLRMRAYNENDVVCALQLLDALVANGLPCPMHTWQPTKARAR